MPCCCREATSRYKGNRSVTQIMQAVPGGCLKGLEEWAAYFHSS